MKRTLVVRSPVVIELFVGDLHGRRELLVAAADEALPVRVVPLGGGLDGVPVVDVLNEQVHLKILDELGLVEGLQEEACVSVPDIGEIFV